MKSLASKLILPVGLLFGGFAGGVIFEHERNFSHPRLKAILAKLRGAATPPPVDASTIVKTQRTVQGGAPTFHKEVDSAILPLEITGYRAGAQHAVAKFAGGIAAIGNDVVVVDRLAGFFVFQKGEFRQLHLPKLPTNIEGFVKHGTLRPDNFRVHDVEYLPAERSLAVSHELYYDDSQKTGLVVSLIAFDPATMQSQGEWRTVWRGAVSNPNQAPASPGAGRLAIGPNRLLYLTTIDHIPDDFTDPTKDAAQNPDSLFGKIVKIDLATGAWEIVSRGHRNPQGLTVTRAGELISTEHGPGGGDELNFITPGSNYGWPHVTLGTEYDSYDWPSGKTLGRHDGYTAPLFAWTPAIAPSNLIELSGFHPRWDGDLLVGSLKACSLFRVRREGSRVLYDEPIWIGERIRDLAQLADGTIVLWTDDANLLLVKVNEAKLPGKRMLLDTTPPALADCLKCHHFGHTTPAHPAPTLSNVFGRPVATDHFSRYSPGLKAVGGVWDADRLREFLNDPAVFAPGTTMPKTSLTEAERETIIRELERQTNP